MLEDKGKGRLAKVVKKYFTYSMVVIILLAGCGQNAPEPRMEESQSELMGVETSAQVETLEVKLIDREGVSVGLATLTEVAEGVQITVNAHYLPEGVHGFHIHEHGLCEAPTFESAGGHFNPTNKLHGFKNPQGYHAGDMENLEVKADGTVEQTVLNKQVTLQVGKPNSLIREGGTSLVIHENADDYESQPAGNAGERIVCGVIKVKGQ